MCVALLECVKFLQCDENASVAVNKVRSRHSATKLSLSLSHLFTPPFTSLRKEKKRENKFTFLTSQIPNTQATKLSWPFCRKWCCMFPEADWVYYCSVVFVDSFIHRGKAMGSYEMREG